MTVQTGTVWLLLVGTALGRLIAAAFVVPEPEPVALAVKGDFLGAHEMRKHGFLGRWPGPMTVAVAPPEPEPLPVMPVKGGKDGGLAVIVRPKPEMLREPKKTERTHAPPHAHAQAAHLELCAAHHMRRENYTNEKGWKYWRCVKPS